MLHFVREATAADYIAFYRYEKVPAYCLWVDGERVAMGGLIEREGELWAFFDVKRPLTKEQGLDAVRNLRRGLDWARSLGRDVFIICDKENYPQAPRLLKLCGFKPTEIIHNGSEVWKCLGSNS